MDTLRFGLVRRPATAAGLVRSRFKIPGRVRFGAGCL